MKSGEAGRLGSGKDGRVRSEAVIRAEGSKVKVRKERDVALYNFIKKTEYRVFESRRPMGHCDQINPF